MDAILVLLIPITIFNIILITVKVGAALESIENDEIEAKRRIEKEKAEKKQYKDHWEKINKKFPGPDQRHL